MMTSRHQRQAPNILITGTPGVGKSTMCKLLNEKTGYAWLEISKIAIESGCTEEWDEEYKCPVLDEDKLLDIMEPIMNPGGKIVDYHSVEFFPERWFDIVFVLRTDNTLLYDRLVKRGYLGQKLQDNVTCEIFQTILEEARNSYKHEIVHELQNNDLGDINENVNRICLWIQQWKIDNQI